MIRRRFSSLLAGTLTLGLLLSLLPAAAPAQSVEQPKDPSGAVADSATGWTYDATAGLNASQAAYKNWEEGAGNNSLAFSAGIYGQAAKRGEHWIQLHEIQLDFGIIDQEEQELRKAEDLIQLNTSLRYDGDGFFHIFNPTIAGNLRTQFAKGFDYTENPFDGEVESGDPRLNLDTPVQTSEFFSPAFITESIGLTYEPLTSVTFRLGAASKQTVVLDRDYRVLYGVSESKNARVEAGAEFAAAVDRNLTENIRYRSQLNAFYAANATEEPPDARWQNTITLKVNDWLSTDLEFVALYDEDITNAIQLKETISVGVSFALL
jgi:hypothetical protein